MKILSRKLIFGDFWSYRDSLEILGKFWIVFGDFQGVSESFGEFWRFLEIFRRHPVTFPESFKEYQRISKSFGE